MGRRGGGHDLELIASLHFSAIAGLSPSLLHKSTVGKLPAAFWKPKQLLLPPVCSARSLPQEDGKITVPALSIPRGFSEGSAELSRGVFSSGPRWPCPLLGTFFLPTLGCFTSQDTSLPECDHMDPVYSLSL